MKMMLLLAVLGMAGAACALDESEGKAFDPPPMNRPWTAPASGLRFPDRLAGLPCTGGFQYNDPKLGSLLRYESEEMRLRVDVFVYPCPLPTETSEELRAAAEQEMERVQASTLATQRMGYYSEMKAEDPAYMEFNLYPPERGKAGVLSQPVRLVFHENTGVPAEDSKVKTVTTLIVFRGHFVKLRSTQPDEPNEAADRVLRSFVDKVQRCVLDPGMRPEIRQHIAVYQADPFSAEAQAASAAIMAYAQITPLITFKIHPALTTLAEQVDKEFPDAALMLLRAYVAGVVAQALQEPLPEQVDVEQAGAQQVLRLYDLMKARKPGTSSALMEELRRAAADQKAAAWLAAHDPHPQAK